jgi:dUTP pyrophosphatase
MGKIVAEVKKMQYYIYFNYRTFENKPIRKKGGWFDIPLPYDIHFEAGDIVKIIFDLRIKMPEGFEAIIQPRSSTLERTGLISSGFGVIEDSYCGENDYIGYRFYATKDGTALKGSCLVQMRFQEKMKDFVAIRGDNELFKGVESRGGFGSTDKDETLKMGKEELKKKGKVYLSNMYGKSCAENVHINQLDWEPEQETEYQQGFSTGFDEGHMDGYEEGFRDGYDRCIEDLKLKFNEKKV